jgi:4'-phosphopantetheinyl transferase
VPDVWHASLEPGPDRLRELAATLSADESDRAARFRFDRDRRRFVAARGILREILGSLLGHDPAALLFVYGPQGKPALRAGSVGGEVFFNVAHSSDRGAFAVAAVPGIGVDVEVVRPVPDAGSIARRFFSREECAAIAALPAPLRLHAFFCCWTRKEAYVKALGEGLSHPLDGFAVSVAPGGQARLLHADGSIEGVAGWRLHDLSDLPAFACALAVRDDPSPVRVMRWAPQDDAAVTVT